MPSRDACVGSPVIGAAKKGTWDDTAFLEFFFLPAGRSERPLGPFRGHHKVGLGAGSAGQMRFSPDGSGRFRGGAMVLTPGFARWGSPPQTCRFPSHTAPIR